MYSFPVSCLEDDFLGVGFQNFYEVVVDAYQQRHDQ